MYVPVYIVLEQFLLFILESNLVQNSKQTLNKF